MSVKTGMPKTGFITILFYFLVSHEKCKWGNYATAAALSSGDPFRKIDKFMAVSRRLKIKVTSSWFEKVSQKVITWIMY